MLTSYDAIKQIIVDNWEYLKDIRYPEDDLVEFADSEVPVYTHEIIQEWQDLPRDFQDEGWRIFSPDMTDLTITDLMRYDLYHYYQTQFDLAYRDVEDEMDDTEPDVSIYDFDEGLREEER